MKSNYFLLCIFLSFSGFIFAQQDQVTKLWNDQFGFTSDDIRLVSDKHGDLYIAGTTEKKLDSSYSGKKDAFVRKYGPKGDILWTIQIGGRSDDTANSIVLDKNGNCLVTGKTNGKVASSNTGYDDIFVVKIDPSSKIIWKKQFGSKENDIPFEMTIDNPGNTYITGVTEGNFSKPIEGNKAAFIVKLDPEGKIVWKQQYENANYAWGEHIALDKDDNVYVDLTTNEIIKYDVKGSFISSMKYNVLFDSFGLSIDDAMNIYLGGQLYSKSTLIKYDPGMKVVWERQYKYDSNSAGSFLNGMKKSNDKSGNMILSICENWPGCFAASICYDTDGNLKWTYMLKGSGDVTACGRNIASDGLGNYFVTGFTNGSLFRKVESARDIFIEKFNITSK